MTTARLIAAAGLTLAALAAQTPVQAQTREEQACAALAGRPAGSEGLTIDEARFYANRTGAARLGAAPAPAPRHAGARAAMSPAASSVEWAWTGSNTRSVSRSTCRPNGTGGSCSRA